MVSSGLDAVVQVSDPEAGMAEIDDAREVGQDGPRDDGEGGRKGSPEDEGGDGKELEPMGELTPAGFGGEGVKVGWVGALELRFGNPPEPRRGVGKEVFPPADEKEAFVEAALVFRRSGGL